MAGCLGQELEAVFFPSQSGCLLNTPHSALGASFKGFPQNPLDKHLLPRRNPQAAAEAGLHGTLSSWVLLFASNCGAPEGDHICTAGSAPRGHSPSPPPAVLPEPQGTRGHSSSRALQAPSVLLPFPAPQGRPGRRNLQDPRKQQASYRLEGRQLGASVPLPGEPPREGSGQARGCCGVPAPSRPRPTPGS